jgi:4-hydroxythreonine-4-phosphate dehydrogenase
MSPESKLPRIGISLGDYNGIGPEVIIKTLSDSRVLNHCQIVIYGSTRILSYYKKMLQSESFRYYSCSSTDQLNPKQSNVISVSDEEPNIEPGKATQASGEFAAKSLRACTEALAQGEIEAMVTAPIDKSNIQGPNFEYPGHTEFLSDRFDARNSLMLMCSDDLRVGLVTNHLALRDVPQHITAEQVWGKLKVLYRTLKNDFGLNKPKIAVLGLNPHASDQGMFGDEEEQIISPAIREAEEKKALVFGPYPADGFFGSGQHKAFDAVLAMYHDQGLIPFKLLSFGQGTNYTAGLPVIRTSPDHGTAFNLAGQGVASPDSFRKALFQAVDIAANRAVYGIPEPV